MDNTQQCDTAFKSCVLSWVLCSCKMKPTHEVHYAFGKINVFAKKKEQLFSLKRAKNRRVHMHKCFLCFSGPKAAQAPVQVLSAWESTHTYRHKLRSQNISEDRHQRLVSFCILSGHFFTKILCTKGKLQLQITKWYSTCKMFLHFVCEGSTDLFVWTSF